MCSSDQTSGGGRFLQPVGMKYSSLLEPMVEFASGNWGGGAWCQGKWWQLEWQTACELGIPFKEWCHEQQCGAGNGQVTMLGTTVTTRPSHTW